MNAAEEVTSLTSLMAAAQCGHLEIATKLIKAGSNVNTVLKVIIINHLFSEVGLESSFFLTSLPHISH